MGQVHPLVAANFGADCELYAAELKMDALFAARGAEPVYRPLPRFPAITRDLALLCDEDVSVGSLTECIRRGGGALLRSVEFFDVYRGKGIPQGKKSVAFSLTFRAADRTLTDDEVQKAMEKVQAVCAEKYNAIRR